MTTAAASSPDILGSSGHMLPLELPDGFDAAAERSLPDVEPASARVAP